VAADKLPGDEPWYRKTSAIVTAGVVGLVLLAALVVVVIQMSADWSKPITTVLTTPASDAPPSRDKQTFVVTPSDTPSSSFTTSVPVSTTDIGLPGDTPSTTPAPTTTSTTGSETTTPGFRTTFPPTTPSQTTSGEPTTTSTHNKPRYNETRTLYPPP
jgi:cytoskeletal protein RodZ